MRRLWHLPGLVCSFVWSLIIIKLWNPFAGMGTGALIAMLLGALVVSHFAALVAGLFLLNVTWRRHVIILSVAVLPVLLFSIGQVREAYYLRFQAVYDR